MSRPKRRRDVASTEFSIIEEVEGERAVRLHTKRPALSGLHENVPNTSGIRSQEPSACVAEASGGLIASAPDTKATTGGDACQDTSTSRNLGRSGSADVAVAASEEPNVSVSSDVTVHIDAHRSGSDDSHISMLSVATSSKMDTVATSESIFVEEFSPLKAPQRPPIQYSNPVLAEYVDDMYNFYKSQEPRLLRSDYMCKQAHITEKMRAILIDWLVEVAQKYRQLPETLYLAVSILDTFLHHHSVCRTKLQLVGITSLFIASKYEQPFGHEVRVQDMVYVCDKAYTAQDVRDWEASILRTLQFRISMPTPFTFLVRLLKVARVGVFAETLAYYLSERMLQEYALLFYRPSLIAAAVVNIVVRSQGTMPAHWSAELQVASGYDASQLEEVVRVIEGVLEKMTSPIPAKLEAVRRKYLHPRYMSVAAATIKRWDGTDLVMVPPQALLPLPSLPASNSASATHTQAATNSRP